MQISNKVDNFLDEVQAILLSILVKLGPFAVALMPALFTAYAIYFTYQVDAGENLALFFAIVVGLAMETVGIVATHTAIDLYNGKQSGVIESGKFWLMVLLVPAYVLGVAGTVYYSENAFTPLVKSLGIASPFLTCIVYIAVALARDYTRIKQGETTKSQYTLANEQEDRAFSRQLKLQQMQLEQERELKRIESQAKVQIEQAKANSAASIQAQSQLDQELKLALLKLSQQNQPEPIRVEPAHASFIVCPDCGKDDFDTIQGLNAHRRWCPGRKNGIH